MLLNNLSFASFVLLISIAGAAKDKKYRFCVVDGKGAYKKGEKLCPLLDSLDSPVECVLGLDRLDCLRRIHKGKADFAAFTSEDLVTAANAGVEVLVTNELRYAPQPFEYRVVAVVDRRANVATRHDLKGKRFCHPGYGNEADWTRILANYLEASVITPQCSTSLTMTENRIKAASEFFQQACKAGPWSDNPLLDITLKSRYSNLCGLCGTPWRCDEQDRYWGRRGALFCLTDGAGEVAWARWDDVRLHFGLGARAAEGGDAPPPQAAAADYALLCPDDEVRPLTEGGNATDDDPACAWVAKPWSAVAAGRAVAQEVQALVASLSHADRTSWRSRLLDLVETAYLTVDRSTGAGGAGDRVRPIEEYLRSAPGFLSANSFAACHPPRTVRLCTTSVAANAKCAWMREAAAVYGVDPDIDCLKADNATHCMTALSTRDADLLVLDPDLLHAALSQYNLKVLFYETVPDKLKYMTVAVTLKGSPIETFEELKGAKACFPSHDGVAWNSLLHALSERGLIESCGDVERFLGSSCVPGHPRPRMRALCQGHDEDEFAGEEGALRCLNTGRGDVAFVSKLALDEYAKRTARVDLANFKIVCPRQPCHLSWSPLGYGVVRADSSQLWLRDTLDVFQKLDNLFGKNYRALTAPFSMFGRYDGHTDLLFHDATERLRNVPVAKNTDKMPYCYTDILREGVCVDAATSTGHNLNVPAYFFFYVVSIVLFVF